MNNVQMTTFFTEKYFLLAPLFMYHQSPKGKRAKAHISHYRFCAN